MPSNKKSLEVSISVPGESQPFNFPVDKNVTGRNLKASITRLVGLRETFYFGLRYVDQDGHSVFLGANEKLCDARVAKDPEGTINFGLRMIHVPDLKHLQEFNTIRFCFEQVREDIQQDSTYCTDQYVRQHLDELAELVDGKTDEYQRTDCELMLQYLGIASVLHQYGKTYFEMDQFSRKYLCQTVLSVSAKGLAVYEKEKLNEPLAVIPFSLFTEALTMQGWGVPGHLSKQDHHLILVRSDNSIEKLKSSSKRVIQSAVRVIYKNIEQLGKHSQRTEEGLCDEYDQLLTHKISIDAERLEAFARGNRMVDPYASISH